MSEIVKICKAHGELLIEQTRIRSNGKQMCISCILCDRAKSKRFRDNNIDKERLRRKISYENNKEHYLKLAKESKLRNNEKNKITQKHYRLQNKDKLKDDLKKYNLKTKYNLTLEQFNEMLLNQNTVCAICNKPESRINHKNGLIQNLSIDHCHATNKIRGLLCDICNKGIGHFNDSIEKLEKAILYLKK